MRLPARVWLYCMIALLTGCVAAKPEKVFLESAPIAAEAQAPVLFPRYLLMDGLKLHDHGRIPRTGLIGAGMSAERDISSVRTGFNDVLHMHGWETETMEIGRQSFRIIASHAGERIEIRGVQGASGPTQVFLLYTP